jgi:hypothetical protein
MGDIKKGVDWEYDDDCSGKELPDECGSRDSEIMLVVYSPEKCRNSDIDGCEEL